MRSMTSTASGEAINARCPTASQVTGACRIVTAAQRLGKEPERRGDRDEEQAIAPAFQGAVNYGNETSTSPDANRCPRRLLPLCACGQRDYEVATDPRSLVTQATDTEVEVQIKAALLASPVSGTSGIDVYCRQGVVVLAGMVPSGSQAGRAAVDIARQTPNVKRVETYFVSRRPSWEDDVVIKERIRAVLIADPDLVSGRVDVAVYAGHVVLVGVVPSRANVQKFISDARSVSGVVSVTSFIQTVIASVEKDVIVDSA
jgi:osmotically-inducible protein OsmY